MSNEVILLNDVLGKTETYASRYAGPYVIKANLIDHGINTIVLDWFRFISDNEKFFEYLENFIDENTKVIGIANTFLYPPFQHGEKHNDSSGLSALPTNNRLDETVIGSFALYLWENNNTSLEDWLKRLRALLDKYNKNAKIIIGGARSTRILQMAPLAPENYCIKKYVDYIIVGMADYAIKQLVEKIRTNEKIDNLHVYHDLNFIFCDREPWKTPITYIPTMRYNKSDCFEKSHWAGLEVGRGCAFNCKYCYYEKRFSNKKPIKLLEEEIKRNYYDLGITKYNITADCFNDNRKFVGEWAEMVASLNFNIEWASYVRVDPFHKWPEMMDEMIGSGFKAGWFGVETLSHEAGKFAGKGLNPETVKALLQLLRDKGGDDIWITTYFIIGLPKETKESLNNTLQWLLNQKIIDEIQTSILDIGPFIEELQHIVDFSDHSKNPDKYGFTKLEYSPEFYWEHETLNLHDCVKINEEWKAAFLDHKFTRFGGSAHAEYTRIRDIGLNHKQTVKYMKTKFTTGRKIINSDPRKKKQFKEYVRELSIINIQNYYRNFLQVNRV